MEHKKVDKKGQIPGMGLFITLFAIVGVVAAVFWVASLMGEKGSGLTVQPLPRTTAPDKILGDITFTEDVTVTFSSFDAYSLGTDAGTAHRILKLDGSVNNVVADDATLEKSPGNKFEVLLGNVTDATGFTAGTTYYPVVVRGILPDSGTYTVGSREAGQNYGGQYLSGGANQLTFTVFDSNGQVQSGAGTNAEALGADDEAKVSFKIEANNNVCIGNPDASKQSGKQNGLTYQYNSTLFKKPVQLDTSGSDQSTIGKPSSVSAVVGKLEATYEIPVVCDNQQITRNVRLETQSTQPDGQDDNISMTLSDISWYVHDDSLEAIADYDDEDDNDLGITDFTLGRIQVS